MRSQLETSQRLLLEAEQRHKRRCNQLIKENYQQREKLKRLTVAGENWHCRAVATEEKLEEVTADRNNLELSAKGWEQVAQDYLEQQDDLSQQVSNLARERSKLNQLLWNLCLHVYAIRSEQGKLKKQLGDAESNINILEAHSRSIFCKLNDALQLKANAGGAIKAVIREVLETM